jgi:hypothetical protein
MAQWHNGHTVGLIYVVIIGMASINY